MTISYTPSNARAHLFQIIKEANDQREPIWIRPANGDPGVVVVAADDWSSIEETLYLELTGTLARVRERERDHSGTTAVDDIDWDAL